MFDNIEQNVMISGSFTVYWQMPGIGYGQYYFYKNPAGELCCRNECMDKDSIKKVLNAMVDNCKLMDRVL